MNQTRVGQGDLQKKNCLKTILLSALNRDELYVRYNTIVITNPYPRMTKFGGRVFQL